MAEDPVPPSTPAPPAPPTPAPSASDQYLAKVIKYIPAPIVAGYTAMSGMIADDPTRIIYLSWAVFFVSWILAPLYVLYIPGEDQVNKDCSKRFHVLASIIAFAVWGFALGGPFAISFPDLYRPLYGSLALILTTLALPLLERILMKMKFFKA